MNLITNASISVVQFLQFNLFFISELSVRVWNLSGLAGGGATPGRGRVNRGSVYSTGVQVCRGGATLGRERVNRGGAPITAVDLSRNLFTQDSSIKLSQSHNSSHLICTGCFPLVCLLSLADTLLGFRCTPRANLIRSRL